MSLESIPVSRVMNTDVKTDTEDQNIISACKIMHDNNIGCVIILGLEETGKPLGIITERDVVRILSGLDRPLHKTPLSDLMTKPLMTISEISSVKDAMEFMNNNNIRRLVAVNNDERMVGIITLKDIFQLINSSPEMFAEFYGSNFPAEFKSMYQRFSEYKFDGLRPYM
jgi:CBS domain-containing protein